MKSPFPYVERFAFRLSKRVEFVFVRKNYSRPLFKTSLYDLWSTALIFIWHDKSDFLMDISDLNSSADTNIFITGSWKFYYLSSTSETICFNCLSSLAVVFLFLPLSTFLFELLTCFLIFLFQKSAYSVTVDKLKINRREISLIDILPKYSYILTYC